MVILLNDRVNMKQIALIILLFVSLTINGQQINYSSNHYRYGDMLEKKQVAVKDFCLNANSGIWRFCVCFCKSQRCSLCI